jgi:hypothetical protein
MFDLVNCFTCFSGQCCQSNPNQHGAGDVISRNSGFSALAFFNTRELLEFSMKLLNFPAQGARILHALRRILVKVVAGALQVGRAAGSWLNDKTRIQAAIAGMPE